MAQYVLMHGGLRVEGGMLMPSAKPEEPTIVELDPKEAKKMGGNGELQLLSEYEASMAGEKAGAAAKAKALKEAEEKAAAKAKAEADAKKGGGK